MTGAPVLAGLLAGRPAVLMVRERSMLPLLRDGDQILVAPPPGGGDRVAPGQIAVFLQRERFLVHRVVANDRARARIATKGDLASFFDPPFAHADLVGIVVARRRPGRPWKRLDRGIHPACGRAIALLAPCLAPAIPWLRRLFGRDAFYRSPTSRQ